MARKEQSNNETPIPLDSEHKVMTYVDLTVTVQDTLGNCLTGASITVTGHIGRSGVSCCPFWVANVSTGYSYDIAVVYNGATQHQNVYVDLNGYDAVFVF